MSTNLDKLREDFLCKLKYYVHSVDTVLSFIRAVVYLQYFPQSHPQLDPQNTCNLLAYISTSCVQGKISEMYQQNLLISI